MLRDSCTKEGRKTDSYFATPSEFDVKHREAALDEGLCESFPASDPLAVNISRVVIYKSVNCLDQLPLSATTR
jgi:hypothetical protein